MKEIKLSRGKVALVDDEDFDWLNQWKWYAYKPPTSCYYAKRNQNNVSIYMHRLIINPPEGYECDHINHNGLDNRRRNLRACTRSQNQQNQISQRGVSQFKGVDWDKTNMKWRVRIRLNGGHIFLGYFETEEIAAKEYNKAAIKYHGEFARLNKIEG